jgi:hypothetical protein
MRTIFLHNGEAFQCPETEQEWLDMQPAAKLRALLRGDQAATLRFHERMRDLDRRFDAWVMVDPVPMGVPA